MDQQLQVKREIRDHQRQVRITCPSVRVFYTCVEICASWCAICSQQTLQVLLLLRMRGRR